MLKKRFFMKKKIFVVKKKHQLEEKLRQRVKTKYEYTSLILDKDKTILNYMIRAIDFIKKKNVVQISQRYC